jgi:DNA-binding response OmpR family regulator
MSKILIVEDDLVLQRNVSEWLTAERYVTEALSDGAEALERIKHYQYDAIILDWMLPGLSGLSVCKEYRQAGGKAPILMLTGKRDLDEKEEGLDAGADDYLTKPFHLKELSARLRALLRRPTSYTSNVLRFDYLTLDPTSHHVSKAGIDVHLLPREYALLEFFMKHPEQVFGADIILNRVWDSTSEVSPESIRTYITRLRSKIDIKGRPSLIKTVHGYGYKLTMSNSGDEGTD